MTVVTCLVVVVAGGCAANLPVPFQLVGSDSKIQLGTLYPDNQRIEVTVNGHVFSGYYIVASGSAISQSAAGRRHFPDTTVTTYYTNSARAHLTADNKQQLNCEFLLDYRRAIGECRSPAGVVYQLNAEENTSGGH